MVILDKVQENLSVEASSFEALLVKKTNKDTVTNEGFDCKFTRVKSKFNLMYEIKRNKSNITFIFKVVRQHHKSN